MATMKEPRLVEHGVKIPLQATLDKYGLLRSDWCRLIAEQGYVCAICGRLPPSGRLNIDHEHVKGYKLMEPWQRRTFVRGGLCFNCNELLPKNGGREVTLARARKLVSYLEEYEMRRPPKERV